MIVQSYGGGIQSVCICVLVRECVLPRPDIIVCADTSREKQSTWDYMHDVTQPYLDQIGLKIEVASHDLALKDLYAPDGTTLMPAFTETGRLGPFCSGEWKRDVVYRYLRNRGVTECEMWIGYSIDELRRVPDNDRRGWCKLDFPLINKMINRAMCRGIIKAAGLPLPLKSRCWSCPHQSDDEWLEVKANPVEWAKGVALDNEIRVNDPRGEGLYLWSGRKPLEMADFGGDRLTAPVRACEGGHCWT